MRYGDYRDGQHFLFFFSLPLPIPPLFLCSTRSIFNHLFTFTELSFDSTIRSHLEALYDTLLEQNLLRIVEPYCVVEIAYVAETIGQERQRQAVEAKCVAPLQLFVLYILTPADHADYRR